MRRNDVDCTVEEKASEHALSGFPYYAPTLMPLPCIMVVRLVISIGGSQDGELPYIGLYVIMGSSSFVTSPLTSPWNHSMHTSKTSVVVDLLIGLTTNLVAKQDKGSWYSYIITFVNREAVDKWLRMISTPLAHTLRMSNEFPPGLYLE